MLNAAARIVAGCVGGGVGALVIGVNPIAGMTFALIARTISELSKDKLGPKISKNYCEYLASKYDFIKIFEASLVQTSFMAGRTVILLIVKRLTEVAMPILAPNTGQAFMLLFPIVSAVTFTQDCLFHYGETKRKEFMFL